MGKLLNRFTRSTPMLGLGLLSFVLVFSILNRPNQTEFDLALEALKPVETRVGAYYVLQNPESFESGYLREKLVPPQEPLLGRYSSWDLKVVEQHIAWASEYGVDFFALQYLPNSKEDARFELFLQAGNLADVEFCIHFKAGGLDTESLLEGLDDIRQRFLDHPQYLKVSGRPLLILSRGDGLSAQQLEEWKAQLAGAGNNVFLVLDAVDWNEHLGNGVFTNFSTELDMRGFDGITAYSLFDDLPQKAGGYAGRSLLNHRLWYPVNSFRKLHPQTPIMPCAIPGYNDRGANPDSAQPIVDRRWFPNKHSERLLPRMLRYNSIPLLDKQVPLIFIRSWNEWYNDTAIEPLRTAPATSKDKSGADLYTGSHSYEGFRMTELEHVRDTFVAVSGAVTSETGRPLPGVSVHAWQERRLMATSTTDNSGIFRFSSSLLTPGVYRIGTVWPESLAVGVTPDKCRSEVNIVQKTHNPIPAVAPALDLTPKLPTLRQNLDEYMRSSPDRESNVSEFAPNSLFNEMERLLGPGDTVVEVGAARGEFTLELSRKVGPVGKVYAIEPLRASYRQLVNNLRHHDISNTTALHYGLAEDLGATNNGNSSGVGPRLVEERALDSFHLPVLNLLCLRNDSKVVPALTGSLATLRRTRAKILFPCADIKELSVARGLLASVGYSLDQVGSDLYRASWIEEGPDRLFLDFGTSQVQHQGFSETEYEGQTSYAWSTGGQSELTLSLELPSTEAYSLGIRARALPELVPLEARVSVNDVPLATLSLQPEWGGWELKLPPGTVRRGDNQLTFQYSKWAPPTPQGDGPHDQRTLAMALDAVWLAPSD